MFEPRHLVRPPRVFVCGALPARVFSQREAQQVQSRAVCGGHPDALYAAIEMALQTRSAIFQQINLVVYLNLKNILRADQVPSLMAFILDDRIPKEADDIYRGDARQKQAFGATLARLGLTEQSVADAAFHAALEDMERLQQLIDNANARRDAVLREIDRRRDGLAKRLRETGAMIDNIIDAEFE